MPINPHNPFKGRELNRDVDSWEQRSEKGGRCRHKLIFSDAGCEKLWHGVTQPLAASLTAPTGAITANAVIVPAYSVRIRRTNGR